VKQTKVKTMNVNDMTLDEWKNYLKELNNKLIYFSPPPKTRQTRYKSKVRGNFLGNNLNNLNNRRTK
jgi:hypothetical protein